MNGRKTRSDSDREQRVAKVLKLFRELGTLDSDIVFEPSFKAVRSRLFADRFLLGINRQEASGDPDERIALICRNIGMPDRLWADFERLLPAANYVYFGAETNARTLLFKAYLEFRDKIEAQLDGTSACERPYLLFTGLKWDAFSPDRHAVTRYDWYPALPVQEMLQQMRSNLDLGPESALLELARCVTAQAAERIPEGEIQYLEVTEAGNPRRSFDINIYKSGLRLGDVLPELSRALQQYAIPPAKLEALYERIKTARFGHLAGGVDREHDEFLTVYYGVQHIHSSQLGSATVA